MIPVYLLAGGLISMAIPNMPGVLGYYVAATVLPTIGLVCTKYLAPYFKIYNIAFIFVIGNIVAYALACPVYYPEGHELAYSPTYMPYIVTVVWSSLVAGVLIYNEARKSKP
jgi:hypothetical protein